MHVLFPASLHEWHRLTQPFLRRQEALHGLMLGIAADTHAPPPGAFWGVVQDGDEVVAACLCTWPGHVVVSDGPREALALLSQHLPRSRVFLGPTDSVLAAAQATERPHHAGMRLGVYQLSHLIPAVPVPGEGRQADPRDLEVLLGWYPDLQQETLPHRTRPTPEDALASVTARLNQEELLVWEVEGQLVAQAGVAGPTRGPNARGGGLRVNSVYTPPPLRGQGYASALVAWASQHILDQGYDFAYLYTDLTNATSNSLYQRLGYQWVGSNREEILDEEAG